MILDEAEVPGGGLEASSDGALVGRAVGGDRAAFAVLVERHYGFIFQVAFRWCGNRANAEDITQEVCVRLAKAIGNFKGESRFTTWLYAMVINAERDLTRKVTRDAAKTEAWGQHNALFGEAEVGDDQEERIAMLWQIVQQLPAKQRDAVLLIYGEGLSHGDASEVMGCAEATVSWHIHEAKKRLKLLAKRAEET